MSAYRCRACGAGVSVPKTGARAGRVPRLCLTCRLAEVEEDLAALHAAHAPPPKRVLNPRCDGYPTCDMYSTIPDNHWHECSAHTPIIEVLSPAEQDARSWAIIEQWHARLGEDSPALDVSFLGPFIGGMRQHTYYARLPNGVTKPGATRSDALAHLAGWCQEHPFG